MPEAKYAQVHHIRHSIGLRQKWQLTTANVFVTKMRHVLLLLCPRINQHSGVLAAASHYPIPKTLLPLIRRPRRYGMKEQSHTRRCHYQEMNQMRSTKSPSVVQHAMISKITSRPKI